MVLCRWEHDSTTASSRLTAAPTHKNDMCYWLYTSGSTGLPKAVMHLHHDPYSCLRFALDFCRFDEQTFSFCFSKTFFALGLFTTVFLPLASGGKALISRQRLTPPDAFPALLTHRPTHFFCVPTVLNAMLQLPRSRYNDGLELSPLLRVWRRTIASTCV